ncbi:ABC transporter permease [Sphingomonas qilianensis]|uniref:Transport permease protein n=1 Tax=Sphingomonas qilianensis TaxID=1736690 RepID=A0ABU9XRC7_9SPHN
MIGALMIRELTTRFGRENIGFLWIMVEPLLFAGLVGLVWRFMHGPEEHGVSVIAFVATGYIPLTLFRHAVSRALGIFTANGSLMYHRQIKILDFVLVRFLIEMIGTMMAYVFIATLLIAIGEFPVPHDIGYLLVGFVIYAFFTLSICLMVAPLSEMSEVLEKFMPVTVYIMVPFSGTFTMVSWLAPGAQEIMLYSPPVSAMELMRYGIFGDRVTPHFDVPYAIGVSMVCMLVGLVLCRRIRKTLVVE